MNDIEKRMLEILKELKEKYNILGIKAEFEAEGTRKDELIRLQEIIHRADLDTIIKIGGCEAVSDLQEAKILGINGVMSPMIESPFAMTKYINMIDKVYSDDEQKDMKFIFNAETIACYENLDEILEVAKDKMTNIAVGRVDFSASLGLSRADINTNKIFDKVKTMLDKGKKYGLTTGIGGGISLEAIPFINQLGDSLDLFETRKVVFRNYDGLEIDKALVLSTEFELLYLKNKEQYYSSIASEDLSRIDMMQERLDALKLQVNG